MCRTIDRLHSNDMQCEPTVSTAIADYIKQHYGDIGQSETYRDSYVALAERTRAQAANDADTPIRTVIPAADGQIVPISTLPTWTSCDRYLSLYARTGGVLKLLPAIWQATYPLQRVVRRHNLYSIGEGIHNIPICTEAIDRGGVSIVVTYPEAARALVQRLQAQGITHKLQLLIIIGDPAALLVEDLKAELQPQVPSTQIMLDLQALPGFSVAYQTPALANESNTFHFAEQYLWQWDTDGVYVTGIADVSLPVVRLPLALRCDTITTDASIPTHTLTYEG